MPTMLLSAHKVECCESFFLRGRGPRREQSAKGANDDVHRIVAIVTQWCPRVPPCPRHVQVHARGCTSPPFFLQRAQYSRRPSPTRACDISPFALCYRRRCRTYARTAIVLKIGEIGRYGRCRWREREAEQTGKKRAPRREDHVQGGQDVQLHGWMRHLQAQVDLKPAAVVRWVYESDLPTRPGKASISAFCAPLSAMTPTHAALSHGAVFLLWPRGVRLTMTGCFPFCARCTPCRGIGSLQACPISCAPSAAAQEYHADQFQPQCDALPEKGASAPEQQ